MVLNLKRIEIKRNLCEECGDKEAIYFRYDGKPRRDKEHSLCSACYRALQDRLRMVEK